MNEDNNLINTTKDSEYEILNHSGLIILVVVVFLVLIGSFITATSFFKADKLIDERDKTTTTMTTIETTTLNANLDIEKFNSQFTSLEGEKNYSEIYSLIGHVQASNNSNLKKVKISLDDNSYDEDKFSEIFNNIDVNNIYVVVFNYDNDGYIYEIVISTKVE